MFPLLARIPGVAFCGLWALEGMPPALNFFQSDFWDEAIAA
jgi:hypothetical protein